MAREVDRLAPVAGQLYPMTAPRPAAHSPGRAASAAASAPLPPPWHAGPTTVLPVRARRTHRSPAPANDLSPQAIAGWLAAALATLVVAGVVAPGILSPAVAGPVSLPDATAAYRAPVPGPVRLLQAFVAPPQPWSSGHRGIDLAVDEGGTVLAPAAGAVTVAGRVVDRGVVTIAHPDGRRSSLEPVSASVVVGQEVGAGDPVGTLADERSHCSPVCLHWGVREGDDYVDPLALLPGGGPIVLLPEGGG